MATFNLKKGYNLKLIGEPKKEIINVSIPDVIKINPQKFKYIKGNDVINDFNLFSFAKHFIVGGSSYHWWGAWLNEYPNKICIRPSTLNPSDNKDFYPESWIAI